jgi:capsular polysaccharide biosynthesis protein
LFLGLGLGGGLTFLREVADTSYKTPDEMEKDLQVPVLVSLPFSYTEEEMRSLRIKDILRAASVAVGFVVCAVGIVFATKGIDKTINFTKTFLTNLGVL